MNNNPPIQILKFFGLHAYWINNETANFNSRFKLHLYPCFLCIIYLINLIFSIIDLKVYLNDNIDTLKFYVYLELHFIFSFLVNLYPIISCINCILCYQHNEKILLKLHEFNITMKNREKQKLCNIIIQWCILIMILFIRFLIMFYSGYNWHQLLRYFISFSLLVLDQLKFIIFVKEMIQRFIILNKMFLTGESKILLNLSFSESGCTIHFIHKLHVMLRDVIKYFNRYYSCLALMWIFIFIMECLGSISYFAETFYIHPKFFMIPFAIICIQHFIIIFTIISNSHKMSVKANSFGKLICADSSIIMHFNQIKNLESDIISSLPKDYSYRSTNFDRIVYGIYYGTRKINIEIYDIIVVKKPLLISTLGIIMTFGLLCLQM